MRWQLKPYGRPLAVAAALAAGLAVYARGRRLVVPRHLAGRKREEAALEQAARAEAEAAQRRSAFLAEASDLLASSLDYETTLQQVARLAVPALADWCTVYMLEEDGVIRRVATAYADPAKAELAQALRRYRPSPVSPRSSVAEAMRTGRPVLTPVIPERYIETIAQDAEHYEIMRRLAFRSSLAVPLRARGEVLGALALYATDVGREYSATDLALAEDLARRAALAVDNARLYRQAQELLHSREEFVSGVSHDLRSPLTTIKGQTQLLQQLARRSEGPAPEWLQSGLARIESSARKMQRQLDDLLDSSRLQLGQQLDLRRAATDLVELARQAVTVHQQTSPGHRIRVEASDRALTAVVDPARLERALDNLLDNAVKYSPNGGDIVVSLAREQEADTTWAVLRVADQGIGIPAADLPTIFERFRRAGNVGGRIGGTGIGLASARQIVEQHGGTIAVESTEGQGSTFVVRLPLGSTVPDVGNRAAADVDQST